MTKVYSYEVGSSTISPVNDRLEVPLTLRGSPDLTLTVHTSYKKHLLSSYVNLDDAYSPTPADKNTIATIGEGDFKAAFEGYARHIGSKLVMAGDTDGFKPSDLKYLYASTKGIKFGNDDNHLTKEIHAFPVKDINAVELNKNEFIAFVDVMRFLFSAEVTRRMFTDAVEGREVLKFHVDQHKLFTPTQLIALRIKITQFELTGKETIEKEKFLGQMQKRVDELDPSERSKVIKDKSVAWVKDGGSWGEMKSRVVSNASAEDEGMLSLFE